MDVKINMTLTGDCFVDTGGMVLKYLIEKNESSSILDIIDMVSDIYINNWNTGIHSVYHGSKISHPSKKITKKERKEKTHELYYSLVKKYDEHTGNCRICGRLGYLSFLGRDQYCLSGSHAFVNYHHAHEDGIKVCPDCSIKLFFLPLGLLYVGGNLALLYSANSKISHYWCKKTVVENLNKIGRNTSDGILKYNCNNPQNALFQFAYEIIGDNEDVERETLTLYHFSNFAASPNCSIYVLNSLVFSFLSKVFNAQSTKGLWYLFVRKNYHVKDTKWDWDIKRWIKTSKNELGIELDDEDYISNSNPIYTSLLEGKSILRRLTNFYRELNVHSHEDVSSYLAKIYAEEVLGMQKEQLDIIKRVSDTIFIMAEKENEHQKYLRMIEGCAKAYELRRVLVQFTKKTVAEEAGEPLIRLDEYVLYLFPDGQSWGEVRDLMLIYLYEKLHDSKIKVEEDQIAEITHEDQQFI